MWVEKTRSGKFKYVEQYTEYMTGKKKRVSVTLEKDTASAKRTALETLTRMIDSRQSIPAEQKEITLEELIEKYREYQAQTVKASTYKRNFYAMETIKNILGHDIIVNRLTANYIKEQFLASGRENSTLNEHRVRLFALLHWGYENDYIHDVSYLQKVKPFKDVSHREKIQDKYLEPEEVKKLLKSMKVEKWKLLTNFLLLSGLRIGEAVALDREDIDFDNHVIKVQKNYDPNNEIVTTPKTLTSFRDVYMQQDLETITRSLLLYTMIEGMETGHRSSLLVANSKGTYMNYYTFNKYLKENAIKAIGRPITTHTLRHTHASLLLAQGIDVDTISRRLGHEDSKITKEIYLHVTQGLKERDNERIRKIKII